MVTRKLILDRLETVIDPELGLSIVDLGLVYDIRIMKKRKNAMQKVFIRMTFTTPACPLMNEILNEVKERLDELKELDIELTVTFDPPWTPERMSRGAKLKLGML